VICGKEITYYINRIEHPSGLSPKIRPVARFVWLKISVFHRRSGLRCMFFMKNIFLNHSGMHLIWSFFICLPIHWWWKRFREAFKRSASVDIIWITRRDRDSGEQTTWINRVSVKEFYVWGVNSTVNKHSDYFVWKDTSERVTRRCDDTVDKKRVNSCVLKYLFRREFSNQKNRQKNRKCNALLTSPQKKKSR